MKTKLLHWLDFFFALRPTLFFPVWTVSLAGVWAEERFAGRDSLAYFQISWQWPDLFFIAPMFMLTSIMGASFLLNQIADIESDRVNNKLYLLANGVISIRFAYGEVLILTLLPLLMLLWLRWQLAVFAALAFLVTGLGYSCRPFLMENNPWGGLMTNILGALTIFGFGWMIRGCFHYQMIYRSLPYLLGILAVYFLTTIPDIRGDAAANKITVAVRWGVNRVIGLALGTHLAAIAAAWLWHDLVVLVPALLVLPFFVHTFRRKSVAAALQTNKFAALFLSLAMCVRFPSYLLLLVALFFFSKWYYAARFNIKYPSFSL